MLMMTMEGSGLVHIRVRIRDVIFVLGICRAFCNISDEDLLGKRRRSEV
jgi:hypothetical protein